MDGRIAVRQTAIGINSSTTYGSVTCGVVAIAINRRREVSYYCTIPISSITAYLCCVLYRTREIQLNSCTIKSRRAYKSDSCTINTINETIDQAITGYICNARNRHIVRSGTITRRAIRKLYNQIFTGTRNWTSRRNTIIRNCVISTLESYIKITNLTPFTFINYWFVKVKIQV